MMAREASEAYVRAIEMEWAASRAERDRLRALDWTDQLRHMFRVFEQDLPEEPGWPDDRTLKMRIKLIREEVGELLDAIERRDMVETVDGAIDAVVVTLGLLLALGVDPRPHWAEIHRTNLAKAGGPVSADGKRLKPAGWQPPDLARILYEQGWRARP
jgi:predicted HAD superfamily Cof-like phosphohydrolase